MKRPLDDAALDTLFRNAGKEKLVKCVSEGNAVKVRQAPVTAIIAMDEQYYEKVPYLFPHKPEVVGMFKDPVGGKVHMMRKACRMA
jgi:hypothetical protein